MKKFKSTVILLVVLVMCFGVLSACRPNEEENSGDWENIGSGGPVDNAPVDSTDTPEGDDPAAENNEPGNEADAPSAGENNTPSDNESNTPSDNESNTPSKDDPSAPSVAVSNPLIDVNKKYNHNATLSYDLDAIGFSKGTLDELKGKTLTLYTGSDYAYFGYSNAAGVYVDEWSWYKEVKKAYGLTIKYVRCPTGGQNVLKPFQAMSAGKDIDLITVHGSALPYICNVLSPLESYFNFDKFDDNPGLDPMITKYTTWKGKKIVLGPNGHSDVLNYNVTMIKNAGLDDPYTLFKQGNWNWTTFKQLMTSLPKTTQDGKKVYGYVTSGCWWVWPDTNGAPAFSIDNDNPNGGIVNNFDAASTKEAFIWLESVCDAGGQIISAAGYPMLYGTDKTNVCAMFSSNGGLDPASASGGDLSKNEYFWVPFPKNEKNPKGVNQVEVPGDSIGLPRKTNKESNRAAAAKFMDLWVNRFTECEFDNLIHVSGWTQEQVVEFYEYGQKYGMMGLGAGLGELQKKAGSTTNFFKSITDASFSTATCMEKLSNYAKSEIDSVLKFGVQ